MISMKELLFSIIFFFLSANFLIGQAGLHTVCPTFASIPAGGCGCTNPCNPVLCSPTAGGNCSSSPSAGSMVISVPANQNVGITVTTPTCSAIAGLDTGESYTIGSVTKTSTASGSTPSFMGGCLATGGAASSFIITVRSQRQDECIDVNVTFTPNGGTPDPSCELLTSLPVELITFKTEEKKEQVHLSWATASEIDNDYFQIEHSTNGLNFKAIDRIEGVGNSFETNWYNYTHENPSSSINYYRLKQVDYDGSFEYSHVESILYKGAANWSLYPTLAGDQLTVAWSDDFQPETIHIFSLTGKLIFEEIITRENNAEEINIQYLPEGTYFLQIKNGRSISTKKFIKI